MLGTLLLAIAFESWQVSSGEKLHCGLFWKYFKGIADTKFPMWFKVEVVKGSYNLKNIHIILSEKASERPEISVVEACQIRQLL